MSNARCRCDACRTAFCSVTAFDMHRTGEFASVSKGKPSTRRCLTLAAMRAKGMKQTDSLAWSTGREVTFSQVA